MPWMFYVYVKTDWRPVHTVRFFLIATAIPSIARNGLHRTQWKCSHYATATTSPTPLQPIVIKNKSQSQIAQCERALKLWNLHCLNNLWCQKLSFCFWTTWWLLRNEWNIHKTAPLLEFPAKDLFLVCNCEFVQRYNKGKWSDIKNIWYQKYLFPFYVFFSGDRR